MDDVRDDLECPRILSKEEIDFDEYTIAEIKHLIACGSIQESDVIDFYNNEWWDETP